MLVGDPREWTARFRSLDERFLECVLNVWAVCIARLPADPHEDAITFNLVDILKRNASARRLFHHLEYHHEPTGYTADGCAYSKGQIDMALLLDQEGDHYLAYECKRLNVSRADGTRSQATDYVLEGVLRFIEEKYAANLPVGCMLGYVMDGNAHTARAKILAALKSHAQQIGLLATPIGNPRIGTVERFSSRHIRASNGTANIEIRHALLPNP